MYIIQRKSRQKMTSRMNILSCLVYHKSPTEPQRDDAIHRTPWHSRMYQIATVTPLVFAVNVYIRQAWYFIGRVV